MGARARGARWARVLTEGKSAPKRRIERQRDRRFPQKPSSNGREEVSTILQSGKVFDHMHFIKRQNHAIQIEKLVSSLSTFRRTF